MTILTNVWFLTLRYEHVCYVFALTKLKALSLKNTFPKMRLLIK